MTEQDKRAATRNAMRDQRASLPVDEQQGAAGQFAGQVLSWSVFHAAQNIACYVAVRGELDSLVLARLALEQSKAVYLPVLREGGQKQLEFRRWTPETRMEKNRFGIPEPVGDGSPNAEPTKMELVFVPLTAVDRRGNRLGQGAGFYDRSFAFLKVNDSAGPVMAGAAYDFQVIERIEPESWDVPLDFIVTPAQIVNCADLEG